MAQTTGNEPYKMILSTNGKTATVTLASNQTTEELLKILPVTVEMTPYGGFEVVGPLPKSLPTTNSQITTEPGDLMLYQGNQLVIFYGSNSWSYTRIGHIDGATVESVKELLGSGSVTVTLSQDTSTVFATEIASDGTQEIYDLSGNRVDGSNLTHGLYIIDGKTTLIK